jgi:hypothetical protein
VTSNLAAGGRALAVEDFLGRQFPPDQAGRTAAALDALALGAAAALDRHYAVICELGVDIGVDRTGRVWLIETNLKPGRRIFLLLADDRARMESVRRPIAYACALAGFARQNAGTVQP